MSRVSKKPIEIPENVEVKIEGQKVFVKGPKGELFREFPSEIKVEVRDQPVSFPSVPGRPPGQILVSPKMSPFSTQETKKTKAILGTSRAIIANMIKGVTEGYEKKLQIEGLGFRANLEGDNLILQVGFTHPIKIKIPEGLKFLVEKNIITVSGIDKEKVSQIAAKIRKAKPPEPYKGKGIRYVGEVVRRKAGKKVVTTTG